LGFNPGHSVADNIARCGDIDMVKYLAKLNPPILPGRIGVDNAVCQMAGVYLRDIEEANTYIQTLHYLASLTPPILPTGGAANYVCTIHSPEALRFFGFSYTTHTP
jgi:hypothetical protein